MVARKSVESAANRRSVVHPQVKNNYPLGCGAFVSLHRDDHQLRGCIGCLTSPLPLFELVQKMANSAASSDPRFEPVQPAEVSSLTIEISVLEPPVLVTDENTLQIGVHGLVVEFGAKRGVLLPQVATNYAWDVPTFIAQTCHKANVNVGDYRSGQANLYSFSAQVFSERSV